MRGSWSVVLHLDRRCKSLGESRLPRNTAVQRQARTCKERMPYRIFFKACVLQPSLTCLLGSKACLRIGPRKVGNTPICGRLIPSEPTSLSIGDTMTVLDECREKKKEDAWWTDSCSRVRPHNLPGKCRAWRARMICPSLFGVRDDLVSVFGVSASPGRGKDGGGED